MKKQKGLSKFLALGLTLTLAAGSFSPVWAGEQSGKKVSKEETVYVMAESSGAADKIVFNSNNTKSSIKRFASKCPILLLSLIYEHISDIF